MMTNPFNQSTPNFDNLLLQSLMSKLQIRPPPPTTNPLLSRSFEDLLLDAAAAADNFFLSDDHDEVDSDSGSYSRTQLEREEAKLEKEIVRIILTGKTESLKPNSSQAVPIGEHYICVGFQEESGSDYRVWEWHGHVMLVDDEEGCMPEYVYGNYFEKLPGNVIGAGMKKAWDKKVEEGEEEEEEKEETVGNLGLKELIGKSDSDGGNRIVHRSLNADSSRF